MAFFADLLLALHVVCTGVSASGPLICIWLEWREARGDAYAGRVGRRLLNVSIILLIVGGLLGALAGGLLWNDGLHEALRRLSSKAYYGIWELIFSIVLMVGHSLWWRRRPQLAPRWRWLRAGIAFLAGTNLLYHFPVLFVVITDMVHRGDVLSGLVSNHEFRQQLVAARVVSRVVHFMLAALSAGGVALMACSVSSDSGAEKGQDLRAMTWGARLALLATLVQIPVGLWVLTALSPLAQRRLLGGDLLAVTFFVIGLAAALGAAHLLTAIALGEQNVKRLRWTVVAMTLTLVAMTLTSRRAMARPPGAPSRDASPVTLGVDYLSPRIEVSYAEK